MNPSAAINLMSLNAARYLGCDRDRGSIEEGKQADLAAFTMRQDFAVVSHVWVDGSVQLRAGLVTALRADGANREHHDADSEICSRSSGSTSRNDRKHCSTSAS